MDTFKALLLALAVAGAVAPAAAQNLKNFAFPREGLAPTTCAFAAPIPSDVLVLGAGEYGGKALGIQIDDSGHEATQIDVAVNSTHTKVVLMLGAYEPTIWNIGWSAGTRIVGVIVSGYHAQKVAGLPATIPVLNSTYDNHSPCGFFYFSEGPQQLDALAQRVLGRKVDQVYLSAKGTVVVGDALDKSVRLLTSKEVTPASLRRKNTPPAGKQGLEDALRKGVLREATEKDFLEWDTARQKRANGGVRPPDAPIAARPYRFHNSYVVLKRFRLPAGLYGSAGAVFLVPQGVATPTGELGHSALLDFKSMTCTGIACLSVNGDKAEAQSTQKARSSERAIMAEPQSTP